MAENVPRRLVLCVILPALLILGAQRVHVAEKASDGQQISARQLLAPNPETMRAAGILLRLVGDDRQSRAASYLRRAGLGKPCDTCGLAPSNQRASATDDELQAVLGVSARHYELLTTLEGRAKEVWTNGNLDPVTKRARLSQLQAQKEALFVAYSQDLAKSLPADAGLVLEQFIETTMKPRIQHGPVR